MNVLLGVLGSVLIITVLGDVIRTSLSMKGAGVLSGRFADTLWSAALYFHQRHNLHGLLSFMGTGILVAVIAMWVLLLWVGWSLFFAMDPGSVVLASSGERAGVLEKFYFAGYTLITLGNGEYRPDGGFWQLATLLASTTGFFAITLSITFLLSVLPAVVGKRKLSSYIASLGMRPDELIVNGWHEDTCQLLADHFNSLNADLSEVAQQHLAYPVLHYFHSTDYRTALPLRLAALDEALGYLLNGLDGCEREAADALALRHTTRWFLDTLENVFIKAHQNVPDPPPLHALEGRGIALRGMAEYLRGVEQEEGRRQLLLGYLRKDGWAWEDVFRE